jgi:hypothetical protein
MEACVPKETALQLNNPIVRLPWHQQNLVKVRVGN